MSKTPQRNDAIASVSIRTGTERILTLIRDEVNKVAAKSRDDLSHLQAAAARTETSLGDQCSTLEKLLADARSDLGRIPSAQPNTSPNHFADRNDRLEKLLLALENAGFVVDSNDAIKFGPMVQTLALEVDQIAGQSLEGEHGSMYSVMPSAISAFGTLDLLRMAKQYAEGHQKLLATWKQKCIAAEQERDGYKNKATDTAPLLKAKDSEIAGLQADITVLKKLLESTKNEQEHTRKTPSKRPNLSDTSHDSDSDVPLVLRARISGLPSVRTKRSWLLVDSDSESLPESNPKKTKVDNKPAGFNRTPIQVPNQKPSPSRLVKPPTTPVSGTSPFKKSAPFALTPQSKPLLTARSKLPPTPSSNDRPSTRSPTSSDDPLHSKTRPTALRWILPGQSS